MTQKGEGALGVATGYLWGSRYTQVVQQGANWMFLGSDPWHTAETAPGEETACAMPQMNVQLCFWPR